MLVVGADVGGTSVRVVVASTSGQRLGAGRAAGGNPTTHDPREAAGHLAAALGEALRGGDPARVGAAVLGVAGYARLAADPAARAAFDDAWRGVGLTCRYTLASDALVAFAAGTAEPHGTVLIAGTGAIAAAVRDRQLGRIADGHGWLLGDDGSGFWLGRGAVRVALSDLDHARQPGPLSRAVLRALLGSDDIAPRIRDTAAALVQRVRADPPVALAALAPLVFEAYRLGDPAAVALVEGAATALVTTVGIVRTPDDASPVVLAGGLLTADTPLAAEVATRIAKTWPDAPRGTAGDGAAAAAWLAALDLAARRAADPVDTADAVGPVDPAELHRALLG